MLVAAAGRDAAYVADGLPSWSSRGPEVEIAAPGASVLSTCSGGGYATMSGTSMATPHVTGAAALIWGAHPGYTAPDVRAALTASAQDLNTAGWDSITGYGLVRPDQALGVASPWSALGEVPHRSDCPKPPERRHVEEARSERPGFCVRGNSW